MEKLISMTNHLPLSFVQQKIIELRNALFFPTTESLLQLSVCIVNVIKVDELGQIWFAIPLPAQNIRGFNWPVHKKIPVRGAFPLIDLTKHLHV